ncbi:SRPBCC family protein [Mycolicibacterium hippocampi]|jgi:hypothetical protein|uniref:SRPBCC family protein n=1 Tax=Mycobacteriaceae TaxID=1762 RepID=UPI0015B4706D|nr:SRPBCC family protein [Mycolicibacterium hippocampi]
MNNNMVRIVGAVTILWAARSYYRNWGTTKEECRMNLPGDELIRRPSVQSTEGIWIDAPPSDVWPWLVQIGLDRGGLYCSGIAEVLIGPDHAKADGIHHQWQHLAPGDTIRLTPSGWLGLRHGLTLTVDQVVDGSLLVLRGSRPGMPWDTVWSFHLLPRWEDRCRLLIRTRTRLRHPGEVLGVELAGPMVALLTRGMLLGIKHRADPATPAGGRQDTPEPSANTSSKPATRHA